MLDAKELKKSLEAAGHKIVEDTLSKEELHYYDTHHFGKCAKKGIKINYGLLHRSE